MALQSTGANGYITLGYNNFPNNSAAKSISFWYTVTTYNLVFGFFNVLGGTPMSVGVQIGSRGSPEANPYILAWRLGGTIIVNSNLAPAVGAMHHCVYTYDGVNVSKIYVDGALANSATAVEAAGAINSVQFFGNQWNENGNVTLDDFRMYNRAISLGEVETIFSCRGLDDIYYGLVSRWRLTGQTTGTHPEVASAIRDTTISGNDGISFSNAGTDYTYQESRIRFHRKHLQ
jgi:hypothetical protein